MKKFLTILFCCVCVAASAQTGRTIHGTVRAEGDGAPLGGVMVIVDGSSLYAITDESGDYSLTGAADGDVLIFDLLGYTTRRVTVGASDTIDITLTPSATTIEELVVIGYGVQQKKLVTGATVQVKGEDIARLNTNYALGALQSQTPGVNITQASGVPGAGFKVFIRGLGTIGSYGPLYVIDGVAGGDINNLNPADIESIDVLKDAASAAIYGSRAANGVILVTTKQGRQGRVQVSLDGYFGWQNVYRMPDMLNAKEYMMIMDEGNMTDGATPTDWPSLFKTSRWDLTDLYNSYLDGTNKGTNWLDASRHRNAPTRNYTFGIAGGSEVSVFSLGLGYTAQEGILGAPKVPRWERYSARINSEYTLVKSNSGRDLVKLGENLTYTYRKTSGEIRTGVDMYYSDLYSLMRADPLTPIWGDDGDPEPLGADEGWFGPSVVNSQRANPIALTRYGRPDIINQDHILRTNVYLTVEPIRNLVVKSIFGYNYSMNTSRSFSPIFRVGSTQNLIESVNQSMGGGYSWNLENTVTYRFTLRGNHNFTALLGQSAEKWGMGEQLSVANGNPIFHDLEHGYIDNTEFITRDNLLNINARTNIHGSPWGMGRLASFFGRVSYDYKNKYMATVVLRADGSSNFARGRRWGYFPSVSAGWVVTAERFMEGTRRWLDFLKLRASWGQNGNSNIDNFQYLATISVGAGNSYNFGADKGVPTPGSYPDILPNRNISWETSEQIDLGFDATFLRSRLGVTFDYYIKNTKNWLLRAPQLASYGTGAPFINGGDVRNSGVELAFDWNDQIGEWQYGANINMSYNRNRVTRIANEQGIIQGEGTSRLFELGEGAEFYRVQVGRPVGFFYGYKTAGLFQTQAQIDEYNRTHNNIQPDAQPGDVIWVDRNGDNVIDDADRGYMGNPYPDFNLGLNLNVAWKGFDLSLTGNGAFGGQIVRSWRNWGITDDNYTSEILRRWHGEGTSNRIPRVTKADPNGNYKRISDLFVENGSYFKMTNITLGYDFKRLLPAANFLSQLRVYVTVQNLFTITRYSGMDPELGQAVSDAYGWSSGIDVGHYPTPRTWMIGANFKF